jgi:DNA-directed RNA polymerase specialized sigma subunit
MILDDIRKLKKKIDNLQVKVDNFTCVRAITYDKERIQTSCKGDTLEQEVIQLIADQEKLKHLKDIHERMTKGFRFDLFTKRQKQFIKYYYFRGMSLNQVARYMQVNKSSVCKLKDRVVHKMYNFYN